MIALWVLGAIGAAVWFVFTLVAAYWALNDLYEQFQAPPPRPPDSRIPRPR